MLPHPVPDRLHTPRRNNAGRSGFCQATPFYSLLPAPYIFSAVAMLVAMRMCRQANSMASLNAAWAMLSGVYMP